jgi:hypothetical protein
MSTASKGRRKLVVIPRRGVSFGRSEIPGPYPFLRSVDSRFLPGVPAYETQRRGHETQDIDIYRCNSLSRGTDQRNLAICAAHALQID